MTTNDTTTEGSPQVQDKPAIEQQLVPVIVENPALVRKMNRANRLLICNTIFILFDILLSVLFLSMIYGNQYQIYKSANKNQAANEALTTEMCVNTAQTVAERVTSEIKVQNHQKSQKAINDLEKVNRAIENKRTSK